MSHIKDVFGNYIRVEDAVGGTAYTPKSDIERTMLMQNAEIVTLRAQVEEFKREIESELAEAHRKANANCAAWVEMRDRATRAEAAAECHKDNFHAMQDACTKRDKRIAALEAELAALKAGPADAVPFGKEE